MLFRSLSVEKEVTISTIFVGRRGVAEIEVTNNGTEALKFERRGSVSGKYNHDSTHYSGSDKTDEGYVIVNPGETKTLVYCNDGYSSYFYDASSMFYFWHKNKRYYYYTSESGYNSIGQFEE